MILTPELQEWFLTLAPSIDDQDPTFNKYDSEGRPRVFADGHFPDEVAYNKLFSSVPYILDPRSIAKSTDDNIEQPNVSLNTTVKHGLVTLTTDEQAVARDDGDTTRVSRTIKPSQVVINGSKLIDTEIGLRTVATATAPAGIIFQFRNAAGRLMAYKLFEGTDAHVTPLVLRPYDYVDIDNEKVWKQATTYIDDHVDLLNIGLNTHAAIDQHIASVGNPHNVTKSQVGLDNVDNTSDLNKPISNDTQTALDAKSNVNHNHTLQSLTEKDYNNLTNKPTIPAATDVAAYDAHLTNIGNPHTVTKVQVGLGIVDNTSDSDKPISIATQTALDGKSSTLHNHNLGDLSERNYNSLTNLPTIPDLTSVEAHIVNTNNPHGVTKLQLGLDRVSNLKVNTHTVDPVATNSEAEDYSIGSRWINTTSNKEWVCTDSTLNAAIWIETTEAVTQEYLEARIDALTWEDPITSRSLVKPPLNFVTGNRFIVAESAEAVWAGHTEEIATWTGTGWAFSYPTAEGVFLVLDEDILYRWNGTDYIPLGSAGNSVTSENVYSDTTLKAVITSSLPVGYQLSYREESSTRFKSYRLIAGSQPENSPAILIPNDFNVTSNEKIWVEAVISVASGPGQAFDSALQGSLAMPAAWNSLPAGTTIGDLQGKPFTEVFTDALFPTVPAYIQTNSGITLSGFSTTQVEVGTSYAPIVNTTFNVGQINNGDNTSAGPISGNISLIETSDPSGQSVYINNNPSNADSTVLAAYTLERGNNQWTVTSQNLIGTTTYTDNKGGTTPVNSIEIAKADLTPANRVFSKAASYNSWYYVGPQGTAPLTSAAVRLLSTNSLLSVISTGVLNIVVPTSAPLDTTEEVTFYIPQGKTIVVIDTINLNFDVTSNFSQTSININDANGDATAYTKYTYFLGTGGFSGDTIFNVTIT